MKILNKSAKREYEILSVYEAGIVLLGHEVKSIRLGNVSMKGAFVKISDGEAYVVNMHIGAYKHARLENYNPTRRRKLLLKKKEILKMNDYDQRKGVSLVPMALYLSGGKFKLRVGIGRGKKKYEKRADIKKQDMEREMRKKFKNSQIR